MKANGRFDINFLKVFKPTGVKRAVPKFAKETGSALIKHICPKTGVILRIEDPFTKEYYTRNKDQYY